jgi:hypothetical protein
MDEWLAGHGYVDPVTHEPRPVVAALEKATRTLDGLLDKLGMNPRSRAALGADLARTVDLATAMSERDPAKRQDLLRQAGVIEIEEDTP